MGLRALNVYGDPCPQVDPGVTFLTALSFLNCSKYPPSLLCLLMDFWGQLYSALSCLTGCWRPGGPLATFSNLHLLLAAMASVPTVQSVRLPL